MTTHIPTGRRSNLPSIAEPWPNLCRIWANLGRTRGQPSTPRQSLALEPVVLPCGPRPGALPASAASVGLVLVCVSSLVCASRLAAWCARQSRQFYPPSLLVTCVPSPKCAARGPLAVVAALGGRDRRAPRPWALSAHRSLRAAPLPLQGAFCPHAALPVWELAFASFGQLETHPAVFRPEFANIGHGLPECAKFWPITSPDLDELQIVLIDIDQLRPSGVAGCGGPAHRQH